MDRDSLWKVIELERKKGYADTAVIGGLDKFLRNWSAQAAESITDPHTLARFKKLGLHRSDYASLTGEKRKQWLEALIRALNEIEQSGTGPKKALTGSVPAPVKAKPVRVSRSAAKANGADLNSPITVVKGIGPGMAAKLGRLGVKTIRDLLYFFPRRYLDYSKLKTISQLTEGNEETIIANVWEAHEAYLGGRRGTEATLGDETGNVRAVWFNQPYVARRLTVNSRVVLSGRVRLFKGRHVFESPAWEILEEKELVHTGRLVPVYPLTEGLYPRQMRKLMKEVVEEWAAQVEDFLPPELRKRHSFFDLSQAIAQAHYPDDEAAQNKARMRLAFDELFLLQLGVMSKKREWQGKMGVSLEVKQSLVEAFIASLPFALTNAQQRALKEILADMQKPQPMSRLLQGDVGSGKTVVATAALIIAAANGYQSAFMAPTEILAEQHFATICRIISGAGREAEQAGCLRSFSGVLSRPVRVALLVGDIAQSRKAEIQQCVADGSADIIIGTHALIQKGVEFKKLGLAVVDEQHRFGVEQRSALRQKGYCPHMLVMTATPIPRTLALTLYGDLDLSIIDELPPGRQVVKTKWLRPDQRESAYAFIRRQVAKGRQAFIICPLIEESEAVNAQAAVAEYQRLSREVFPDLKLGLLHGRMSGAEKDEVMHRFRAGEMNILVSTPVVEVGIDVPNATVMLVESADRFGLSQLHQFRGRVGRGTAQSYCMLLADNPSEVGRLRLDIIEKVQNGFVLAEEDLKLRGPGEFFGTRQSGLPDLRMAKLSDISILELARNEAIRVFQVDPNLEREEHRPLFRELARVWPESGEWS
jgi:ATP-dependent DNA helicase RecG